MADDVLTLYVVYDHPADFPESYVVRGRNISDGVDLHARDVICCAKVEPLREALRRKGLTCIGRQPEDDPVILEVWL